MLKYFPCESIQWLCRSGLKENILFWDVSLLELANTMPPTTSLQAWGLKRWPAGSCQWTLMFVPGFPTPEGTVRRPDHCPFPEQVSVRDEVALLLPGKCPLWSLLRLGLLMGFPLQNQKKKVSWASKLENSRALGFYHSWCSTESHLASESGDWCTRLTIKIQGLVRIVNWNYNNYSKV